MDIIKGKINCGVEFWNKILSFWNLKSNDLVVVLEEDEECYTDFTLQYLSELKKKRDLDRIFVIIKNELQRKSVYNNSTVSLQFYQASHEELEGLYSLLRLYKFTDRILVNSTIKMSGKDVKVLCGEKGITVQDIVAIGILGLDEVPIVDNSKDVFIEELFLDEGYQNGCNSDEIDFDDSINGRINYYKTNNIITKDKKIVIFGANDNTLEIINGLKDYDIVGIIDNDKRKLGKSIEGISIFEPEQFKKKNSCYLFLIDSRYYKEMTEQILSMGYNNSNIVILGIGRTKYDLRLTRLEKNLESCIKGKEIYDSLMRKYPCAYVFYNQRATGNTYLIGLYLNAYIKKNNIKDYIVIVISKSSEKILKLFNINTVYMDDVSDARSLWQYARVLGTDIVEFRELCPYDERTNVLNMRCYKGLDFNTIYKKVLYELCADDKLEYFINQNNSDVLFEENNLRKEKTILLSPYANTVGVENFEFWIKLASALKSKGYDVCTNCGPDEEPIYGTQGIFITYDRVIDFVNKTAGFIGVRSGLCDIISTTTSKMIIMYSDGDKMSGKFAYDYFSLEVMGLRNSNIIELFDGNNDEILNSILDMFD